MKIKFLSTEFMTVAEPGEGAEFKCRKEWKYTVGSPEIELTLDI